MMRGSVHTAVAVSDLKEDAVDLSEFVLTGAKVTSVAHGYCHPPYCIFTESSCSIVFVEYMRLSSVRAFIH